MLLRLQRDLRAARDRKAAKRKPSADPNLPPFSGFLERDREREKREKGRRRMLLVSLGLHIVLVVVLLVWSVLNVDELFGPAVGVKIFAPGKLPAGVTTSPAYPSSPPSPSVPAPGPR